MVYRAEVQNKNGIECIQTGKRGLNKIQNKKAPSPFGQKNLAPTKIKKGHIKVKCKQFER